MQGQRLIQLYRAAGYDSLADFARRAGIKEVTAQKHVQRDRIPRDAAVAYIQSAVNTGADLDWLLTGKGSSPRQSQGPRNLSVDRPPIAVAASDPTTAFRKIASAGWHDQDLPIRATLETGEGWMLTDSIIDHVLRPGYISPHVEAYAVYMPSDEMTPRYERGDRLLINPALPIVEGKDVILLSAADDQGRQRMMVRRLVSINATHYTVASHNPARTTEIKKADWPIVQRVEGARGR